MAGSTNVYNWEKTEIDHPRILVEFLCEVLKFTFKNPFIAIFAWKVLGDFAISSWVQME